MSSTAIVPAATTRPAGQAPSRPAGNAPASPLPRRADRSQNCFDFLRLGAALLVLTSHMYSIAGLQEPGITPSFTLGGVGLAIFFSISGYLVAQSWISDPSLPRFAVRRALRIFPALIVMVFLSTLVLGPLAGTLSPRQYFHDPGTWRYLSNIFLMPVYVLPGVFGAPHPVAVVNGSLWTLGPELLMYTLVAVFGTLRLMTRSSALVVLALLAAGGSIVYKRLSPSPVYLVSVDLQHILDLGAYFWSGAAFSLMRSHVTFTLPRAILVYSLSALLSQAAVLVTWTFLAIPYLSIAFGTFHDRRFRIPAMVGDLSYGIYLYSYPVEQFVWDRFHDTMSIYPMMAVAAAISALLAWLSWHLVERPALRRKPTARTGPLFASPSPRP